MTQIGWTITPLEFAIKQGSAGAQRLTMEVLNANGSPLSSYAGWTCVCEIKSPFTEKVVITLNPSVTGDAGAHTLTVDLVFATADTSALPAGEYLGDVCMVEPVTGALYYPADITLTIEESVAP